MKKLITLLFSAVLLLSMPVMAAEVDQSRIVNIDASKSIIALGADLSAEQRATVLSLMDVTEADLANYQVVTITNDMEHQYLDAYMDASVIGSKSLSSVKIPPAESGHGVLVTTKNINYCTTGMYRNALLTAGVSDADILGMEVAFVARVGIGGDARLYVGLHFQSFVQNQGAARLDKRGVVAEAFEIGFFGAVYIQVVGVGGSNDTHPGR